MKLNKILKKFDEEKPTRSFVQVQSPVGMGEEFIPLMFWLWHDSFYIGSVYVEPGDMWCYLDEFNEWISRELSDSDEDQDDQ